MQRNAQLPRDLRERKNASDQRHAVNAGLHDQRLLAARLLEAGDDVANARCLHFAVVEGVEPRCIMALCAASIVAWGSVTTAVTSVRSVITTVAGESSVTCMAALSGVHRRAPPAKGCAERAV